jgi:hypothetical protein
MAWVRIPNRKVRQTWDALARKGQSPFPGPCVKALAPADCPALSGPLPVDYEACGTCGYDHAYEPEEAARVNHGAK